MDERRENNLGRSPGTSGIGQQGPGSKSPGAGFQNQGLEQTLDSRQTAASESPGGGRLGAIKEFGREISKEGQRIGSEVGRGVKEEGREIAGELRHAVENYAQTGKKNLTERLKHVSKALHRAADTLKNENEQTTSDVANQAADGIDRFCRYLDEKKPHDLVREVDRVARQQPALVIGGLLLTGLMVGRFLRSGRPSSETDSTMDDSNRKLGGTSSFGDAQRTGYGDTQRAGGGIGSGGRSASVESDSALGSETSRPLTGTPRSRGFEYRGGV